MTITSSNIPPPPEFRGDLEQYSRDMAVYIFKIFREHHQDIVSGHVDFTVSGQLQVGDSWRWRDVGGRLQLEELSLGSWCANTTY